MSTEAASIEFAPVQPRPRRLAFAGAWLLSGAMAVSGVLIYAFHLLAARALGPDAYGQIAVLWAAMFLGVIVLFRPLEQTTSRAMADRLARGEEVTTVIRSVAAVAAGMVLAIVLAAVLARDAITERLFVGNSFMTAMLLAGIACYGLAYLCRGVLAGARWFPGYGLGLLADSVGRLVIAAPLLLIASQSLAAAATVGAALCGVIVPLVVGRRVLRTTLARGTASAGEEFHLGAALAFAAPASAIAAADQLLVNGAPLFVMLEGGTSKTAGIVFAATMLVRVPVFLFQGLAASLLPNLTLLHAADDPERFRRALRQAVGGLLAVGGVVVVGTLLLGPEALRTLYGPDFVSPRADLAVLAAGVGFYLAAATISQALLALDSGMRAAFAWVTAAGLYTILYVALPGSELGRVSIAFALGTLTAFLLLAAVILRRLRHA